MLLTLLETLLGNMDLRINASKSVCIRFGPRRNAHFANLTMNKYQLSQTDLALLAYVRHY